MAKHKPIPFVPTALSLLQLPKTAEVVLLATDTMVSLPMIDNIYPSSSV
jgi:hypothetical protein